LYNWTRAKPFQQLQGKHGERDILFTPLLLIDFWTMSGREKRSVKKERKNHKQKGERPNSQFVLEPGFN
jgi:hypothetical protein